jgi:hypothetical protein
VTTKTWHEGQMLRCVGPMIDAIFCDEWSATKFIIRLDVLFYCGTQKKLKGTIFQNARAEKRGAVHGHRNRRQLVGIKRIACRCYLRVVRRNESMECAV